MIRGALLRAVWLAVPLAAACGPVTTGASSGPQPSAELKALFEAVAYPGAELVSQDVWSGPNFGPFSAPGNRGARVYTVTDSPRQVQAHYVALAKEKRWTFEGPTEYDRHMLGELRSDRHSVRIMTDDREVLDSELVIGRPSSPDPSERPSPGPSERPSPEPTPQSGPYQLRIEAGVNS